MILSGIIICIIVIVIKILLLIIYLVGYNLNIAQYFALTLDYKYKRLFLEH